jgi:hypothetical protein
MATCSELQRMREVVMAYLKALFQRVEKTMEV